jgi:carbon starvation protein
MNAITIAIFALSAFSVAYRVYSKYLAKSVFGSEEEGAENFRTPAHEFRDDVDFVPTNKNVLFGHHFTSISGAGPIVGPAIAVIWGWLPAVLWIVFGAIFIGAVHDFGCLVVSVKSRGRSMAEITGEEIGGRARFLFLILILFLTWIVLAVFAFVIASLFVDYPSSVIPINFEIIVAMALGYCVFKKGVSLTWPSIFALLALYAMVFVGVKAPVTTHTWFLESPQIQQIEKLRQDQHRSADGRSKVKALDFHKVKVVLNHLRSLDKDASNPEIQALGTALLKARGQAIQYWMYGLLIYSFFACSLPVWLLLQPRDYINSHQLMVGLGALYLGLMILNPPIVAPAFEAAPQGAPSWFPFIFVTIACGAISGFHGLVSSGTTSKQLDKLTDARPVAYKAMLGEASLGLIVVLACVAGFRSSDAWNAHYQSWAAAGSLDRKLDAFLSGGSWFLSSLGLPEEVGMIIIAVIVISFAATTLDSAARVQRFVIGEFGERLGKPGKILQNVWFSSFLACATPLLLLNAKTAAGKPLWTAIWPIFGSANQLLGALCLLVLTLWLMRRKKNMWITFVPFLLIGSVTAYAFVIKLRQFWGECSKTDFQNGKLILGVTVLLFGLGLWIALESLLILGKARKDSREKTP